MFHQLKDVGKNWWQLALFILYSSEYRASAKGALAKGTISFTGTNSSYHVFYGNQFFVLAFFFKSKRYIFVYLIFLIKKICLNVTLATEILTSSRDLQKMYSPSNKGKANVSLY